jgi:hypothetical protein
MIFSEKPLMLAFSLKICSSMVVSTNPSQGMSKKAAFSFGNEFYEFNVADLGTNGDETVAL